MGFHVLPMANVGQVVVQRGPIWASWDTRRLVVEGPRPSASTASSFDVARVAARVTTALYDLVGGVGPSPDAVTFRIRSLLAEQGGRGDPSQAAVEVHLGRVEFQKGMLELNLAVYDNAVRTRLLARMIATATGMVEACGGTLRTEVDYALPALVNDHDVTDALERAACRVVGDTNVIKNWRNTFSDDFGLFMASAPGCLMLLGAANLSKGITEIWHRPGFDIDEDALPIGAHIMSLAALDLLGGSSAVANV
jgi:metal-dependent amidase/aminoacylase/carboxypeptidase family protein